MLDKTKLTVLDGATGTMLDRAGCAKSGSTERYILDHPDAITDLHNAYIAAGSDVVLAPTFGANGPSLLRHGFSEGDVWEVNLRLAGIAKENAGDRALVAGDMSPTGMMLRPYGSASFDDVFAVYKAQAHCLIEAGVDLILVETMISAAEAMSAVRAVRDESKTIPVLVTFTVDEHGRTMSGDSLAATLITLSALGIDGFGCNCSVGPDIVYNALKPVAPIAARLNIPLIAKPNAGLPIEDGQGTHYPLTPDDMAAYAEKFLRLGVRYIGGCCGTTPAHIKAIADECARLVRENPDIIGSEAGECPFDPAKAAATTREYAPFSPDEEYTKITDEDDLYDAIDESGDALYLEIGEGGADIIISEGAFIGKPVFLRGDEAEIEKVERECACKTR